ncbi:MAG: asparagine synthase (glutamine-hydrolyzing) [Alphaproteobacteria bacterium]|nr:asparagine synthase (glutamine-hydrolyzing) [Alphaproteobacteria bacterium]
MCGLAGFYSFTPSRSRAALHLLGRNMAETLMHRGPDSGDVWQDPDAPLVLAHRRLAILDLSPEGAQPMLSPSGRYVIVYNGEIYNTPALQKELREEGYVFRGRSDTEVLLALIERRGLNRALQSINGQFAFALWDRQERKLHLVRDRLGKKPLYAGWAGSSLVFASELKALRAHPDFKPRLNKAALAAFLRSACVPAPYCIYGGVLSLPAGHRLSLDFSSGSSSGALEPNADLNALAVPYWNHLSVLDDARAHMDGRSEMEIMEDFGALLQRCTAERLMSDVPVGAFLSGGIDSSLVVALMQEASNRPVKTYTIGFQEDDFNEAAHAAKIAAHLGTDHHEMMVEGRDALALIPRLPEIYDEPFADISAIPTCIVSKFARESVTVALSGDGGDEMLGGYTRYLAGPRLWRNMKHLPRPARKALSHILAAIPSERWDKIGKGRLQFGTAMHKAASILPCTSEEEIYRRLTSQWDTPPVLYGEDALPLTALPEWKAPQGLSFAEKMMYWDTLSYLPNDILAKTDRASMAFSLEVRSPLLDRRIYDFAWSLPLSYKIRGGQGKYLLRQSLKRYVPDHLFERPKQGFSIPISDWLRGPLRDWAETLLDARCLEKQGFLDAPLIRRTWEAHLSGQGNHAAGLWNVLMFQAWYEHWMTKG